MGTTFAPRTVIKSSELNANFTEKATVTNGIFTPYVYGTSTQGAATYTLQSGKYTKLDNVVFFTIQLGWSAHTGTGNTYFAGLPFTSNATNQTSLFTFTNGHALTGSSQFQTKVDMNATTITLEQYSTTSGPSVAVPIDTLVTEFIISGFYFI